MKIIEPPRTKITRATVKAFIKKHKDNLYIGHISSFDGMIDGLEYNHNLEFTKVVLLSPKNCNENNLGIGGAWFVGQSRDYFTEYHKDGYYGIEVLNCCGNFIIAIKE